MSTLGQEVAAKLAMPVGDVDAILAEHHVSTAAVPAVAARLRLRSLRFTALKTLTGVLADGTETDKEHTEEVPVDFSWNFGVGLHGVGSDKNLRGKSSITRILLWALRGRCDLRDDVRDWLRHVELDFSIDSAEYRLRFDAVDGKAAGTLERQHATTWANVGSFDGEDEFEETMGSTMMSALALSPIAAAEEGQRRQHSWPTYSGALIVRGDSLALLLGDTKYSGLPSRLLQMFVGSDWAAARAEAITAHEVAKAELDKLQAAAADHAKAMSAAYMTAQKAADNARARLNALPALMQEMADVEAALSHLPALEQRVLATTELVAEAKAAHTRIAAELAEAEFKATAAREDALAQKFFQHLRPTVCPRCSAPVTKTRREQEATGHSCSVCVSNLDLDAFNNDELIATTAIATTDHVHGNELDDDGAENVVEDIVALDAALVGAADRLSAALAELSRLRGERETTAEVIAAAAAQATQAQERRVAELALARAEGVADALRPETTTVGIDPADLERRLTHVAVLKSAEKVTKTWVTTPQRDRLDALSARITDLARSFGMVNLTAATLDGGARMQVTTGGKDTWYSKVERGEMLRLKVATAIALIEQAQTLGVGRHPGLLFVDSPGSEEMDEDDFDTMLEALNDAATASDIQVIVATRHVDSLVDLLEEGRLRIGRGTNYVW